MATRAQPSINSTEPRLPPPLQLRPLDTQSREDVAACVEGFLGTNWRISHHMNAEKDAQLMSSVPIYVWQRQGRNRAGLLILRADKPAIYWNQAQDQPFTLPLQVPATFTHAGTWILVATLSKAERLLTIEDAWVADGTSLLRSNRYSERWPRVQEAFAAISRQQYFLGCELRLVEPMSFAHFLTVCDEAPEDGTVWEFQPDVPQRRRLVWMIPGRAKNSVIPPLKRTVAREAHEAFIPLIRCAGSAPKHVAHTKPTTQPQPRIQCTYIPQIRIASLKVDKTTNLPDSYWLDAADGQLGRVCVPKMSQSQELRQAFVGGVDRLCVEIAWNERFKKYEVARILPTEQALSPLSVFGEIRGETPAV